MKLWGWKLFLILNRSFNKGMSNNKAERRHEKDRLAAL